MYLYEIDLLGSCSSVCLFVLFCFVFVGLISFGKERDFVGIMMMGVRSSESWESLAPEILALVLQRVLQTGCQERGEGRRIVAVAGVCRSWRQLVLQQQQELEEQEAASAAVAAAHEESVNFPSTASSPLIRFPAAIRKPPALDCPLQCVLKKKGNSFFLFQSFQSSEGHTEEYFLLGARKRFLPSSSSFELSTDLTRLVKLDRAASGSPHVASHVIKSNFARSEFVLAGDLHHESSSSSAPGTTTPTPAPLCVKYSEEIIAGVRRRKLSCGLMQVPAAVSSSSGCNIISPARRRAPRLARASAAATRSFVAWNCFFLQTRRVHSSPSHNEQEQEQDRANGDGVLHAKQQHQFLVESQEGAEARADEAQPSGSSRLWLKSKAPEWNQHRSCWSLDFKGRATMASIHNFQLIESSLDSSSSDAAPSTDQRVVLQLGKVSKGVYILDVCWPLSAFQAFSICLTSFAAYAGLEH
jgi:hypothetical protein